MRQCKPWKAGTSLLNLRGNVPIAELIASMLAIVYHTAPQTPIGVSLQVLKEIAAKMPADVTTIEIRLTHPDTTEAPTATTALILVQRHIEEAMMTLSLTRAPAEMTMIAAIRIMLSQVDQRLATSHPKLLSGCPRAPVMWTTVRPS